MHNKQFYLVLKHKKMPLKFQIQKKPILKEFYQQKNI